MTADVVIDPIVAAIQRCDFLAAEQMCRAHLQAEGGDADVLLLLGLSLQQQGLNLEAIVPYRRLTELRPGECMHWGNYATALNRAGQIEAAKAAAAKAVELVSDEPERLEQLGLLYMQLGQLRDARDLLMRAWEKSPAAPGICIHTARVCIACRDSRANSLLQAWRQWPSLPDEQRIELAGLLTEIGEIRDAVELLEDVVRRVPTSWQAQLLLAKTCERVNDLARAELILRRIVANGGAETRDVCREIARQNAQLAMRRHAYGAARILLEQIGPNSNSEYGHWFSLAKACDKLGDTGAAMRALETAHVLQLKEIRSFAGNLFEPDAPVLPHVHDRLRENDYGSWPKLRDPDTSQSPVFVVGFPRSGTTLLEQMLDAHPSLQSMDERPFFSELADQLGDMGIRIPDDLHKLGQRDCDELRKGYWLLACGKIPRRWGARLVDKNPFNMLWLPMIHRVFPRSQFILALRHPCDAILSCYMQNFRAAPLSVASRSLENLALAYVAAMENWLHHARLLRPKVLISRYEDLVTDPSAQTRRIAEFLGLGGAETMLRFRERAREKGFIATPSYTQVIEPINGKSIDHWRRYREYLEPVLPILQPMLDHWGYVERSGTAAAAQY